jgi:hypothetical protein
LCALNVKWDRGLARRNIRGGDRCCPAPPIGRAWRMMSAAGILSDVLTKMVKRLKTLIIEFARCSMFSCSLKRNLHRLQHLFDYILDRDAIENCFDGIKGTTPLHAALILRCSNDDSVRVDLACCECDQRGRDVVEAVKGSQNAAKFRL